MRRRGPFLDLGCGTGFVALANASFNRKSRVLGVDVNPAAVENARLNARLNRITNAEFIVSDMFSNVSGTFDTIAFNPPYLGEDGTRTRGDLSLVDNGQISSFLGSYSSFLSPQGRAYIVLSSQNDRFAGYMERIGRLGGFRVVERERYFFEELVLASFKKSMDQH
jgi:release factor glutamine methyltransferase